MKNDLQTDRACLEKEKGMLVMKKLCRNGIILLLAGMMMLCIIPAQPVMAQEKAYIYMDTLKPVKSGQYTGNEGDSFVYTIGQHQYTRGNTDIYGNSYTHGIEAWIARWNYTPEISWAYSTYNIGNKYKKLEAKLVLIDSYNTTNFDTTLYFYGDGKLLKKYRMTPSKIPFKISVNVAGVKKLKIYVKDNKAVSGGTSFGIVNCKLYKSQAPKKPMITNINKKKGVIAGTTSKNVTVYANIGTTTYSAKSDKNGKFKIKTQKIKNGTQIRLYAKNK